MCCVTSFARWHGGVAPNWLHRSKTTAMMTVDTPFKTNQTLYCTMPPVAIPQLPRVGLRSKAEETGDHFITLIMKLMETRKTWRRIYRSTLGAFPLGERSLCWCSGTPQMGSLTSCVISKGGLTRPSQTRRRKCSGPWTASRIWLTSFRTM